MIDFTNCRVVPGRAYNGANGSKIAVEYNGEVYMLHRIFCENTFGMYL